MKRRFPYEETDDQLRCIQEIKERYGKRQSPMDRLLCGDVGFGKTEVALRAAFKVCDAMASSARVLVPTTILAWQHYQTIPQRMEGLSRHSGAALALSLAQRSRKRCMERSANRGQVDIVVGTHRLVQKDVKFKDLGLCHHRRGAALWRARTRRALRSMRNNVDVLTLSATPIPRTLNMAHVGHTGYVHHRGGAVGPPPGADLCAGTRLGSVWSDAISKELRRGGQVFYLHNRVDTIDQVRCRASSKLLPDATHGSRHTGKMSEEQLSKMWKRLLDHEIDILVCTTIIETGVDVPNCNTLIIEDADRLGLSQLYQLRGQSGAFKPTSVCLSDGDQAARR